MILTALGSPRHTLCVRKAAGNIKAGTRPLPRGFAKFARYTIDTGQTKRNATTALRLTTIAPDLGGPAALARGSQFRGFRCRERVRHGRWGPRHSYYGKVLRRACNN
jgi:hypothetical protein